MVVFAIAPIAVGIFTGTLLSVLSVMFQVVTDQSLSLISEASQESLL